MLRACRAMPVCVSKIARMDATAEGARAWKGNDCEVRWLGRTGGRAVYVFARSLVCSFVRLIFRLFSLVGLGAPRPYMSCHNCWAGTAREGGSVIVAQVSALTMRSLVLGRGESFFFFPAVSFHCFFSFSFLFFAFSVEGDAKVEQAFRVCRSDVSIRACCRCLLSSLNPRVSRGTHCSTASWSIRK